MQILGRYINGNTKNIIFDDGTRICETEDDVFDFEYARNMDIKITDYCEIGCQFCHEGSTVHGKHGDILNAKFIETLHPYQEVALGGGNVLSHPDLIPFLEKLKENKIITNITLNQSHFMKNIKLIDKLINEKLIWGLGVSLTNPSEDFITTVKKYPNLVIHVINGIFSKYDNEQLSNNNLKILILGYKHLRRGNDYYKKRTVVTENNMKYLKNNLSEIIKNYKVVSFDNLAIEQLDVKKIISPEKWDSFYQGDDGTSTFYIDTVEKTFSKTSTSPFEKRYDLLDSVDEMFNVIKNEKLTIGEIIKNKNYDYVSYRLTISDDVDDNIFAGCFKVKNGEIISLDGDIYYENEEVLKFEEWKDSDNDIENGLDIICRGIWE